MSSLSKSCQGRHAPKTVESRPKTGNGRTRQSASSLLGESNIAAYGGGGVAAQQVADREDVACATLCPDGFRKERAAEPGAEREVCGRHRQRSWPRPSCLLPFESVIALIRPVVACVSTSRTVERVCRALRAHRRRQGGDADARDQCDIDLGTRPRVPTEQDGD